MFFLRLGNRIWLTSCRCCLAAAAAAAGGEKQWRGKRGGRHVMTESWLFYLHPDDFRDSCHSLWKVRRGLKDLKRMQRDDMICRKNWWQTTAFICIYGIYVLHVPEDQEAQAFLLWPVIPAERFMEHCTMRKRHSPKEEIGKICKNDVWNISSQYSVLSCVIYIAITW